MSILEAIILGLVQGIAEFLPISSSGHLAILQNLFNMSDIEGGHMLFDVLLHFGTLVAICFMYWPDIKSMFTQTVDLFTGRAESLKCGAAPSYLRAGGRWTVLTAGALPL